MPPKRKAAPKAKPKARPTKPTPAAERRYGEDVPLRSVKLDPRNPRAGNVPAIAASLARFGQDQPLVVRRSDRVIIKGNHRWKAAQELGWDTVWVYWVDDDEAQALARGLADNRVGDLAYFDEDVLAGILRDLQTDLGEIEIPGFDADYLAGLGLDLGEGVGDDSGGGEGAGPANSSREEEEPPSEPPADPVSRRGDLWILGRHRLLCGDSTQEVNLEALLRGQPIAMVATDPPYSSGSLHAGGRRQGTSAKYQHGGSQKEYLEFSGDNRDQWSWMQWCAQWLAALHARAAPEAYVAVFGDWRQAPALSVALQMAGWLYRGLAVWDKGEGARAPNMGYFRHQGEFVPWGTRGELKADFGREEILPGVFHCPVDRDKEHLTQKPVAVMEWLLKIHRAQGVVVDPFAGSGTTLLAAENLGQAACVVELAPGNCDIAIRRWQRLTDCAAVLENENRTFAEVEYMRKEEG